MHKNDQILQLESMIEQAQRDYYNSDTPLMSDEVYDAMVAKLRKLHPDSLVLNNVGAKPNAPTTITTTNDLHSQWKIVKHKIPMGSLDKVNEPQELIAWFNDKQKAKYQTQNTKLIVMPKFDGLSLECVYKEGLLVEASLRGDGIEGFDILSNVLKMQGVMKLLPEAFTGSLRGEIVLYYDDLQKYFPEYKNVRNSASGICKRYDGEGCEHLRVKFYKMIDYDNELRFTTETQMLQKIEQLGFEKIDYHICESVDSVNELWESFQNTIRSSLPYQIDGLVIELDDVGWQQYLGDSNTYPNHAIAFKFRNEHKESTVLNVTWSTGSSGHITPVAEIEPIQLGGTTVCNVNLHNCANIAEKKIQIGSSVIVSKRNDIIPYIESVILPGTKDIEIITNCPYCGAATEMHGKFLICPNISECPALLAGRIRNWITTIKVLSWGETIIENLVTSNMVSNIADLYKLTEEQLSQMPRLGDKSASKLYASLHAADVMSIPLEKFLGGLSIPMAGETIFNTLIGAGFTTLESFLNATESDLLKISTIGPAKAKLIIDGISSRKQMIQDMLDVGITIKPRASGKFNGMVFCITGAMHHDRDDLIEMIKREGGDVKNSIVKNTTYLICSDTSTVKYKNAVKKGITILSEDDFLKML